MITWQASRQTGEEAAHILGLGSEIQLNSGRRQWIGACQQHSPMPPWVEQRDAKGGDDLSARRFGKPRRRPQIEPRGQDELHVVRLG